MKYQIAAVVIAWTAATAIFFLSPAPWLAPLPTVVACLAFAWLYDDGEVTDGPTS